MPKHMEICSLVRGQLSRKSPIDRHQYFLCLHDATDSGKMPSELLPPEMQKSTPVMEDFSISMAGILKLLKNLKPGKAAGPDRLKAILLKELCEEIAPIIQVIFERSI